MEKLFSIAPREWGAHGQDPHMWPPWCLQPWTPRARWGPTHGRVQAWRAPPAPTPAHTPPAAAVPAPRPLPVSHPRRRPRASSPPPSVAHFLKRRRCCSSPSSLRCARCPRHHAAGCGRSAPAYLPALASPSSRQAAFFPLPLPPRAAPPTTSTPLCPLSAAFYFFALYTGGRCSGGVGVGGRGSVGSASAARRGRPPPPPPARQPTRRLLASGGGGRGGA